MKGSSGKPRAGAVRKKGKGQKVGTGGHSRKALEGKGPTPKAEDRRRTRLQAQGGRRARGGEVRRAGTLPRRSAARCLGCCATVEVGRRVRDRDRPQRRGRGAAHRMPATTLYVASRIEMDDRVKEVMKVATNRGIPILEVMRPELDRLAGEGGVHQGLALKVPPYEYAHPIDLLDEVLADDVTPLFVALDGITDPRNLGAIIRSTAAFGGQGVIVPQRRSVGVTAAAWKTSAGAAARVPVAMAPNLTQTLKALKDRGVFVLGLDGGGDVSLPGLDFADRPIVIVVGSEGKGCRAWSPRPATRSSRSRSRRRPSR